MELRGAGWKTRARRTGAAMACLTAAAALAACGGEDGATADDGGGPAEWDYFIFVPATHPSGVAAQDFADAVDEATDGNVKITVRAAGELPTQAPEALQAIRAGEIEVADAYAGFVAGDSKTAGLLGLPFLATTNEEGRTAIDALQEDIGAEFEEYGAEPLFTYDWNMQVISGTGEPVTSPDGLDGRKVRSSSPQQSDWIESVGGFATTLPTPEVPTALSTGTINSVLTTPLNIVGSGWGDLVDWVYELGVNPGISFIVVNQEAMAELSEDHQVAVREVADEFNTSIDERMEELNADARAELEKGGVTFHEADPEQIEAVRAGVRDYWGTWAQDNDATDQLAKVIDALGL